MWNNNTPPRTGTEIDLYAGGVIDPFNPCFDQIRIEDIAHALSMLCRFNGHCRRFYSVSRVRSVIEERQQLLGMNTTFLQHGRDIVKNATNPNQPVEFSGRVYPDLDAFTSQLSVLFSEKKAVERMVDEARVLETKIEERLNSLLLERGEVSAARQLIPSQVELLRANVLFNELETRISSINELIVSTEERLEGITNLIGTTEDLIRSAARQARKTEEHRDNPEFEKFLRNEKALDGDYHGTDDAQQ